MNKKAQALPLNTIVIAILVIIVLLVIIVFFTTKVGDSGETLNKQSASQCDISNPAIATVYGDAKSIDEGSCRNQANLGWSILPGIRGEQDGHVCCVQSKSATSGSSGTTESTRPDGN